MPPLGQRVVILKGDSSTAGQASDCQGDSYNLLSLPHPVTGQQQQYILTSSCLLEVNRVKQPHTCWLVENTFLSDGSVYMATPISPVFVLLEVLLQQKEQVGSMYQEAESLLCSESWPAAQQLLPLAQQYLPCICDVKALDDTTYYKVNDTKVLAFLRVCVAQTMAAFKSESPGSIAGLSSEDQQLYILRFIKEYIPPAWHEKLVASYGIDLTAFNSTEGEGPAVRPAATQPTHDSAEKRPKVDPKEAARKKAEETRAAAAAAKLKKDAAGTKKISSFFTAKKK